jgi:hypothetical protein
MSGTCRARILYPVVCCIVPLLCILLANPFADSGFIDDWSYSHVALKLAQTGRLHYNGWGSPMILFQTFWGAEWIRIFGFSFNVLRTATLPFSIGFVLLVYAVGRKAKLEREIALFGALIVGTSPLFVPLAASFMTEPYACFFTILCIYATICAAESGSGESAAVWLWILTFSGILGGSDRQSVWAAPLALIPYLWWARRSDRRLRVHAVAAYILCLGAVAFLVSRFPQPYGPFDLSRSQMISLAIHHWFPALASVIGLLLCCALFAVPALFCFAPFWGKLESAKILLLLLLSTVIAGILMYSFGGSGVAPFAGGLVTPFGILLKGEDALGYRPVVLSITLRILLTVMLGFSSAAFFCLVRNAVSNTANVPKVVFLVFSCAYIPLLIPGSLVNSASDRYVLPLLPLLIVFLLQRFASYRREVPAAAWACLSIFAAYSTAITHDYFSALRARTLAARTLEQRGIPRIHISAGLEYDGWTQLQYKGEIKGVVSGTAVDAITPDKFWFWDSATALQPTFVLMYSASCDQLNRAVLNVPFTAWLPPFRRCVVVRTRANLGKTS